jgi:hypothetical protein
MNKNKLNMKNLFSTLLIILFIINSLKGQEIIFDPATFPSDHCPAGMSIVKIGGTKYLQIILNGWNSIIDIPEYQLKAGSIATCSFKYALGAASIAVPLDFSNINGTVQLQDTVNTVKNPYPTGPEMVPSYTYLEQKPVNRGLGDISAKINPDMKVVNKIQFYGQEKINWGPTTGDTMWVGKVIAILPSKTAPITFIVDDTKLKTSTGFGLEGSWKKATGEFDKNWDGVAELAKFYDDGTNGDKIAGDHLWSVTVNLIIDNGANIWKWGVIDSKDKWILVGPDQQFTIPDGMPQTLTYTNTVSVKNFSNSIFKIYPNPASNMISILGSNIKVVEIYNITGSKIIVSNDCKINVSTLAKGVYLAKVISTNGEVSMSKFTKQ